MERQLGRGAVTGERGSWGRERQLGECVGVRGWRVT